MYTIAFQSVTDININFVGSFLYSNQSSYTLFADYRKGWVIIKDANDERRSTTNKKSYLTVIGMHSTTHLMHPIIITVRYIICYTIIKYKYKKN